MFELHFYLSFAKLDSILFIIKNTQFIISSIVFTIYKHYQSLLDLLKKKKFIIDNHFHSMQHILIPKPMITIAMITRIASPIP